ncbi:MAG TPA: cbb3-type cytochrome c oxidase subunit II [Candidatus Synoicihabitans sp.]|nr:cbb3-type cytochrome c oxidase subunit II [Candidatus Synoicihabitans sp.]
MNRGSLLFLGAFGILAFSWTALVLTNQIAYAKLVPHFDENEAAVFPADRAGVAARGHAVYQDLGCAVCHTQQVRRPGFGADQARGWGERQSVARDYLREETVLTGSMRIGPDLRNVGARREDPAWYFRHLYDPTLVVEGSLMPRYPFLFEERPIVGQPSPEALDLPAPHTAKAGYEIVPTERARSLVSYLISLKDTYAFPETNNVYKPAESPEGEAGGEGAH